MLARFELVVEPQQQPVWSAPNPATRVLGRVYTAYAGIVVILSLLWGWQIDKVSPDRYDLIALLGMAIIMDWPRG